LEREEKTDSRAAASSLSAVHRRLLATFPRRISTSAHRTESGLLPTHPPTIPTLSLIRPPRFEKNTHAEKKKSKREKGQVVSNIFAFSWAGRVVCVCAVLVLLSRRDPVNNNRVGEQAEKKARSWTTLTTFFLPLLLSLSYAAESGVVGGVSVNRQEQCSGTTRSERRAKRKKKVKEQRDPKRDLHSSTAVG
jgi:hypothetical protein